MASTTHTPYEIPANPTVAARQPRAAALLTFFETFYAVSDDPVAHEKYARSFTADATLIIGGKRGKGYDEILALRKAIWTSVSSRQHSVTKIFFGGDDDLMLFGKVAYVMKHNGKRVEIDWAARAEFAFDEAEEPKMKYYQVYLDTAAQAAAAQTA